MKNIIKFKNYNNNKLKVIKKFFKVINFFHKFNFAILSNYNKFIFHIFIKNTLFF